MAVAVDATGTEQHVGTASTTMTYTGITVGSGSNRALVFLANIDGGATPPSGITAVWDSGGTNQSMTLKTSHASVNINATLCVFVLRNPTAGNKNLVISWTNANECLAAAISFTGVDQTSDATAFPNPNFATDGGTASGTATLAITSATGNIPVATVVAGNTLASTSQTSIYVDNANGINAYGASRATTGAATVTFTWSITPNADWTVVGCDVAQVAAAANPIVNTGPPVVYNIPQWRVFQAPFNPNLQTNPFPNNEYSWWQRPKQVPKAPFDLSVPLNPNLFNNPVPFRNIYDQAHPFWPITYRPFPDGLNPNIFNNPVPANNGDQSSGAKINPDWAPYPQVGININLQTNPYPVLNQFTPVFDIKNAYPVDQALNINIFTNPVPVQNTYISVKDIVSVPLFDEGYNQNLYTVTVVSLPFLNQVQPSFSLFRSLPQPDVPYNANLLTNPYPVLNLFWAPFQPGPSKPLDPTYNVNLFPPPVAALPFNNYFYPPTVSIPSAPNDFYNLVINNLFPPFGAADSTPSARVKNNYIVDISYNPNLYTTVVIVNPIVATDQFRPVAVKSSLPLDPIYNPNLFTNPYPVQNLFVPVKDIVQASFFEQPDNPNIYAVVVVNPFVPTDIFTVFIPKTSSVPGTGLNPNLFTNPVPFNQFDYPRAKTTPSAQYDLSVILNPNIFLASPIPFAQFDYPLTKRTPQAPIDLSFYFNQNLPPIIPPIVVQPPSGRQWSEKEWNKILQESWVVPDQKKLTDEVKKAAAILSKMGGHARAKALTSKQRTAIASKAASIRWK